MKLQTKIITTTLSVFLISFLFIGLLIFSNSRANLEEQVVNQLKSVSKIAQNNINSFLNEQESKIELISVQSALSNEELGRMVILDNTFYDVFVINASGIVIASSNPERIGLYGGDREYFVNARNQTYTSKVYFALVPKEYSVSVSTPFQGGVLVGAMKLNVFDRITSDRTGLGNTGETLLAFRSENESLVYFSARRFSNGNWITLPKEEARDRPASYAIDGVEGTFDKINYEGHEVIASVNRIDRTGIGVVTQIDTSEAFSRIEEIKRTAWFIVAITIFLMAFVVYIISKGVSREIEEITEDINKITKGDLEIQLKKSSIFEIQSLIDSLNRVLASMKLAILRTGLGKQELGIGEAVKAKEEVEDRFKTLYESSADAMMVLEPPTWRFISGNPATLKMFNVKDEKELQTLGPWDLSPKKQPNGKLSADEAKKQIMKAMKEGKADFEWVHKKYKGEEFPATVLLSRFKLNGKEVLQATVRELNREKKK